MWVKIKKDYDHWYAPRALKSYKKDTTVLVRAAWGEHLIEEVAAEQVDSPNREAAKVAKQTGKLPEEDGTDG